MSETVLAGIDVTQLMGRIREEVRSRAIGSARIAMDFVPPNPVRLELPDVPAATARTFNTNDDAVYHLKDFLPYEDIDFINAAYRAVLQRDADQGGMQCYLSMLRSGASKVEILGLISNSQEGRQRGTTIR